MSREAVSVVAALGLAGCVFIYSTGRAGVPIRPEGFSNARDTVRGGLTAWDGSQSW